MPIKLVVFDWDGTLADSMGKIIACTKFLAEQHQLPLPTEQMFNQAVGIAFDKALPLCFPGVPLAKLIAFGKEFQALMQEDIYQAPLFPYAKHTLMALKERDIRLSVATAKSRVELDQAIAYNDLHGMFDMTCCGEEHQPKPNPMMLHLILKTFSIAPQESLMVGDTITDMQFATNAGVQAVGVTFGAHSKEALQQYKPHAVIDDWQQLLPIIR